jgi:hypothetical protein
LDDVEMSEEDKKKIAYSNYVDSMLSKNFKESMIFLMEMGYLDFKLNEQLLQKYNGKLEVVCNYLASV